MSSQENAFTRAVALHQAGELEQAERLYEQILRVDPQHSAAWHMLGLVVHRAGRTEQAAECIGRAVTLDGSSSIFHGDLGAIYRQIGRLEEAVDSFQQAVELAPEHAQAHYRLGTVLQQRGDQVGAKLRFQQAVRLHPEFAEAWNDLGIAHQYHGELAEAADCFKRLIVLVPGLAGGHFNLGNVHLAQDKLLEAVACYSHALERQPRFVEALNNLGTALQRLGQIASARLAYEAALTQQPAFADARNNLGALLSLLGRPDEAEACYRHALAIEPQSVAALSNLAGVLQSQMRLDEAERLLRQALELDPQAVDATGNLADVLAIQGRSAEAAECYQQILDQQPSPRLAIHAATMLPPVYESLEELQQYRETFEANLAQLMTHRVSIDPTRDLAPVNFLLAYQGLDDCDLARRIAALYQSPTVPMAVPSAPHFSANRATAGRTNGPAARPRIRIGFLSKFLRDHTIGDLTKGLIRQMSRTDFCVSIFLVGEAADETVSFLRSCADEVVSLPEDVGTARKMVADAGLDVLVYPDIGMHPFSYTLAFSRLARVQCVLWGHPVTTGIPTIDHFISSQLVEPEDAARHYTENLVLLESLPTYYYRPRLPGAAQDDARPLGISAREREAARREFDLPQDAHLYVCPQSLYKFHPEFDSALAAILAGDPQARLVLIEAPHRHWTEMLAERLRKDLPESFGRVLFVPRVDRDRFLKLLATADVVLDPFHFGGGNTSFQALGLGLPIVTLPGQFMRGRVTAGCYKSMGLETCVARNAEEYVALSVRLGTDAGFNAGVRSEINARSSVLFENVSAVREFENFFRSVCPAHSTGLRAIRK